MGKREPKPKGSLKIVGVGLPPRPLFPNTIWVAPITKTDTQCVPYANALLSLCYRLALLFASEWLSILLLRLWPLLLSFLCLIAWTCSRPRLKYGKS